jgi:hypothetical protein
MTSRAPNNGRAERSSLLARAGIAVLSLAALSAFRSGGDASPSTSPSIPPSSSVEPSLPGAAASIEYEIAPDGDWIAIWTREPSNSIDRAWAVSLDSGRVRSLDHLGLAGDGLAFDPAGNLRVQVLDRSRSLSEMRWIDLDSDRVVDSTRDRLRIRRELSDAAWATIRERRLTDGGVSYSVVRGDGEEILEVSGGRETRCVLVDRPGLVFHGSRDGAAIALVAVDFEQATERRFAQLPESTLVSWSPSSDGDGVLLVENGLERRARVIDTERGMLLHGPWLADDAAWIEGAEGRYVALTRGPRKLVYDTLLDREVVLEGYEQEWPRVIALDDGRFVVERRLRIEILDAELRPERLVFDPNHAAGD